jgi:phage protein D
MTDRFASVAPVFKVDGTVKGELARDLIRLEIEEDTGGLRTLTARFTAQGPQPGAVQEQLLYLDGAILDFGKPLEVSIGAPGEARTVFKGLLSGLEADFREGAEPEVVAFAEDALMKLRMTRRMRTYEQQSDAQIAEALAAEHGLGADTAADGPTYDIVQQWNQSDLAFLRERARLLQAELWLDEDTLCFKTRGNRKGTALTLVRGNDLVDVALRADLAHQRTAVKVSGYDASRRDVIEEEAGPEAVQGEAAGGRTGPATLQRAFGERVSHRVRQGPLVAAEATAWARAEMLRRCRRFVTVVGTTQGTPDLAVGSTLTLQRVGRPFEGEGYYVTRMRHTYDLDPRTGYRTCFEAERATVNEGS